MPWRSQAPGHFVLVDSGIDVICLVVGMALGFLCFPRGCGYPRSDGMKDRGYSP